ncbi:protein of unknown function [Streptantibioticus cattleyicolor NRRL 8057 = DSM 46488]|nr:protein of unknown function [Streptantibioticus cattleyicolor NRRL 8057 = DSM 46488]
MVGRLTAAHAQRMRSNGRRFRRPFAYPLSLPAPQAAAPTVRPTNRRTDDGDGRRRR